jgi:hypothetical protein
MTPARSIQSGKDDTDHTDHTDHAVVELRQYTLRPGRRDVLIGIFEAHFVDLHERFGSRVLALFRDLDDPDRFVWLRSFRDMPARGAALTAFYESEVWTRNRDAANATLVDHENVLLLRPARPLPMLGRVGQPGDRGRDGFVVVTVYPIAPAETDRFAELFEGRLEPALEEAGAEVVATYVTEPSANNYPRLAIREGESVFVSVARFPDRGSHEALDRSRAWRDLAADVERRLDGPPQILRLVPAARSALT